MLHDLPSSWPWLTADLPGIGGRLKTQVEDFIVEEIPAYPPSGVGEHLFLWVEKRDLGAEYFLRQVATALGVQPGEVGLAGLKDRRAVTRQWISVPARCADRLASLADVGIRVLEQHRHGNKLRTGHLHGNRFAVRLRGVVPQAAQRLPPLVELLRRNGFPNYYGEQRFGRQGETLRLGLKLLQGETLPAKQRFLRKLALSAVQALLFNRYVARRLAAGRLHTVLAGDVMVFWPQGGNFVADDPGREQPRFDARQIVPTGPMFGRKMRCPSGVAGALETEVLAEAGLTPAAFAGFGSLLEGTRRPILAFVPDLHWHSEGEDVWLRFSLPAGAYATVLIGEITKNVAGDDQSEEAITADEQAAP
jgi:tRNA pseudouridine13 synthase